MEMEGKLIANKLGVLFNGLQDTLKGPQFMFTDPVKFMQKLDLNKLERYITTLKSVEEMVSFMGYFL